MPTDVFEPLHVDSARQDGNVVVRVKGEVDVATSPVLREELIKLIEDEGALSIELDVQGMSFIDSTGIGVLVGILRRVRAKGGELTITNPRPSTMRVLEIVGLTEVFGIRCHVGDGRNATAPAAG